MNTNLMMRMFDLRFSKSIWSPESERKLKLVNEIVQSVEDLKFSLVCTGARTAWFGEHFIECLLPDPDCCVCNEIKQYDYEFIQLFKNLGSAECGEELFHRLMGELKGIKNI